MQERTGSTAIDILVNNAGSGPVASIEDTTPELFEAIMSDNMRAPFFATKALSPRLRDGGRMINVGSLGTRIRGPIDRIVMSPSTNGRGASRSTCLENSLGSLR